MTRSIIVCEKSSQAKALRKALGNRYGEIYPARGHILRLKSPDETREEWAGQWKPGLLWPGHFYEKILDPKTRDLLNAIKSAARDADQIIIATDCDREGQLIGGEIVDYLGFRGKVFRAMFNAEDPKSLQTAFSKLKPNEEYRNLYMAGQAREQADQASNLSLTRTATALFKEPGSKGAIGIGRVKTPVLGIVCKRELEIENFKPEDLYEIDARVSVKAGSIVLSCAKMPASLLREEAKAAEADDEEDDLAEGEEALADAESYTDRIKRKDLAEALAGAVTGYRGPLGAKAEHKKQGPPKLFDLTGLQAACSSRWGWSGDKTLKVAQALYDAPRTLLTYPRAESTYLPEANLSDVPALSAALLRLPGLSAHRDLLSDPKPRRGASGHFSDAKLAGSSHHAIIPNINAAENFARYVPQLEGDEARLFDLVARQYLAALAPDYEYRQTTVTMPFDWKGHKWDFRTSGSVPLIRGWKEILGGGTKKGEEVELCPVKNGEVGAVARAEIRTVTTRPPSRYTEGALIKAMKEAWRLVPPEKKELRAKLKETTGIGTPATRGPVVAGLFSQGQLETKGKSIKPTAGGLELYKFLMSVAPSVVDPARTAVWETLFSMVEQGKLTADQAVKKILEETSKAIDSLTSKGENVSFAVGGKSKPTPKMADLAKKVADRKGIKLPRGVLTNSAICRQFLDDNLPKREPGQAAGTFPPSDKQLAFAQRISDAVGVAIPEAAKVSSKDLSAWIDANNKKMPPRAPSEKQLDFARKLAKENGIDLPAAVQSDMKACSSFIDAHMGKAKKERA